MDICKYSREIEELVEASHRLAELGYVTSSGGNLSMRVDDDLILITPTKTFKRKLTAEEVCAVDLQGNTVYAPPGKKPTGETPFHAMIMRERPEVVSVVHAHPPVLTGFAIADSALLELPILPEPVIEVGPIVRVKYATPISDELSDEFQKVVDKSNCFLMENHGVTMCNVKSVIEAVEQMQMVECMAMSTVVALALNGFKPLSKEAVANIDWVIQQRELPMPGKKGKFQSATELYNMK